MSAADFFGGPAHLTSAGCTVGTTSTRLYRVLKENTSTARTSSWAVSPSVPFRQACQYSARPFETRQRRPFEARRQRQDLCLGAPSARGQGGLGRPSN